MAVVYLHAADFSQLEGEVWNRWQAAARAAYIEAGEPIELEADGLPLLCTLLDSEYSNLSIDVRDDIAVKLLAVMGNALDLMDAEPLGGVH